MSLGHTTEKIHAPAVRESRNCHFVAEKYPEWRVRLEGPEQTVILANAAQMKTTTRFSTGTEALVRIPIPEKRGACYAVTPMRLVVSVFSNFMGENEVVSCWHVFAALGANTLEAFVRIPVEKQSSALQAVMPVGLVVVIFTSVVRQHEMEPCRHVPAALGTDA